MAQVVSNKLYALESSIQLTRPDFKSYLRPDTNIGQTDIATYNESKKISAFHVPNTTGPLNNDVNCCESKNNKSKYYFRANLVKNKGLQIYDPLSNFVSPAGELILNSGKNIPSLGKARREPQTSIPQENNSIRQHSHAIDEIKRIKEGNDENFNPQLNWNTKKVIDIVQRSRLGGWTSNVSTNKNTTRASIPYRLNDIYPNIKNEINDSKERNELAKSYRFKTSIQQMYEQVSWDSKLPKKLHAPITTYEAGKVDPLKDSGSKNDSNRRHTWQSITGISWDRLQTRSLEASRKEVQFTDRNKRSNQLPGYSGNSGGRNNLYKEEVHEKYEPLTVLRTQQPKEPAPNFKSNIPGYVGKTHYFKTTAVSHNDLLGRPFTTTAAFHREMPLNLNSVKNTDPRKLLGDFVQIQTKVPPQNPFDNIKRITNPDINNSIDHVKYSI